ncbi:hypothetical protein DUNSADRAFT_14254 [Dunaliella salina]|uniref:Encoded protein n=1 Tax=Dunaliella salina TaxID=3046 RepID=A0ABQ7G7Q1_DUNSA|nr:hypothetical protein DUNSADRAFT_14254 [Dunaliella salina]|eukprot:KAF5830630.1 hypothetical protein DUNSADRAFT_14254 [Dunaliella salina]
MHDQLRCACRLQMRYVVRGSSPVCQARPEPACFSHGLVPVAIHQHPAKKVNGAQQRLVPTINTLPKRAHSTPAHTGHSLQRFCSHRVASWTEADSEGRVHKDRCMCARTVLCLQHRQPLQELGGAVSFASVCVCVHKPWHHSQGPCAVCVFA